MTLSNICSTMEMDIFHKINKDAYERRLHFLILSGIITLMKRILAQKGRRHMNRVLDVARYVVNYSNQQNYGVSNLKLQKLLYLAQAYFLLNNRGRCFSERIEAWDFGPVVPEAYHEFKRFGSGNIPTIDRYWEADTAQARVYQKEYREEAIPPEDRKLISEVVDNFKDYSATALVKLTHNQTPWCDAYVPGLNREIEPDSIQRYFSHE